MRQCDDPPLSSPMSIFVRHPDVASYLRSLPALEHSPYRHAPVTAFEWAMLLAGIAWVVAVPMSDALVPSLGSWNPRWRYPTSGVAWWTMTPALRAFYDYVASNYAVVDVVGPQRWVIYARRTGPEMR